MLSLVERWHESGKTQQLFYQENNLAYTTFYIGSSDIPGDR